VALAAIIALPGGGSLAAPVHDGLRRVFGVGDWLAAIALVVIGIRLLGRRGWAGGVLAAVGGGVVAISALGLLGLLDGADAGAVGRRVSVELGARLGDAATAVLLVAAVVMGLVLAIDLRAGKLAAGLRQRVRVHAQRVAEYNARWQEQQAARREAEAEPAVQTAAPFAPAAGGWGRRGAPPGPEAEAPADAQLIPVMGFGLETLPTSAPALEAASEAGSEAEPELPLAGVEPFRREFEGLPVDTAEAPTPPVAATTDSNGEVAVAAAAADEPDEPERVWVLPPPDLLDIVTSKRERLEQEIRQTITTIETTLAAFGVEARVRGVNSGPTVTQYELQPGRGVPVRKVTGYQTDLSLALAAPIRIQAPIPGKAAIGLEVPNKAAQLVTLRDIVGAPEYTEGRLKLPVALGADVSGHPVVGDLTRMPHMLIAGATGSGKSVCLNAVLAGLLLQNSPAQLKLILIDPKRVELNGFMDIPHLLVPVVVEPEAAVASLRWAVREMEERYRLFAAHGARNIAAFNERAGGLGLDPLPFIVLVIDELADLMMVASGEIEDLICRIAQLARAVGIHLIVATQRPSADIITGLIKANIPSRIAFAVSSGVDSRVILDEMGAEKLLGRGDMLYLPIDEGKPRRLQGAYVSDRELERIIDHWKGQGLPTYQEEIFQVEANATWAREAGKRDPLFAKAAHTVAAEGRAAASLLQRKLNVGYTRAARLVDQLAEHRIVGPYEGSKSRDVLMDVIQVDELLAELGEE
jgi:S-DNA-T family DNA segregation ATPase FtsK/SpoIIIE